MERVDKNEEMNEHAAALQILYAESPPFLTALNVLAWNHATNLTGQSHKQIRVPALHRMFAHFHPFSSYYASGKDRRTLREKNAG